jgi:predicted DNA-binding transcriptional regulator AlpA
MAYEYDRLIPVSAASDIVGICRSKIYELVASSEFPKPIKIGKSTRFSERECHGWVADRIRKRDGGK